MLGYAVYDSCHPFVKHAEHYRFATTFVCRGRVVWQHGQLHVHSGTGRFIPLPPMSFQDLPGSSMPQRGENKGGTDAGHSAALHEEL